MRILVQFHIYNLKLNIKTYRLKKKKKKITTYCNKLLLLILELIKRVHCFWSNYWPLKKPNLTVKKIIIKYKNKISCHTKKHKHY